MKCPTCVAEGKRSRVVELGGSSTAIGFSPYYDEDGNRHVHDPNAYSQWYQCSNGHEFAESRNSPCPSCNTESAK